jgi:hypothetical protein
MSSGYRPPVSFPRMTAERPTCRTDGAAIVSGPHDHRRGRRRPGTGSGELRLLIETVDDFSVVGEAADGIQAVEVARQQRPDVVLMDIRIPLLNGIEATARITADNPRSRC